MNHCLLVLEDETLSLIKRSYDILILSSPFSLICMCYNLKFLEFNQQILYLLLSHLIL